ncbi:hypothetical protein OpiT1DRAFT_02713 [Opitutaceae bacterium TAV1]|nr:hypothetical protein OpiT1DRAFT_02713 [Opitutaceae bacterium TAV1]
MIAELHPAVKRQPRPRTLCAFAQRRYLTYPHANGFADGGRSLVFGQRDTNEYSLWKHDLVTGAERHISTWPRALCPGDMLWFDIARHVNRLAVVTKNTLHIIDLGYPGSAPVPVYRPSTAATLIPLPSITADGTRVILGQRTGINGHATIDLIEISLPPPARLTCSILHPPPRPLARFDWPANHFHLCPADETWIGLCHEGPALQVAARVWAWHAQHAPRGRPLFDNAAAGLAIGHERWAFHSPCTYAVAYGESPREPRGVYQIFNDARPARLISEGNRDWHVSPSHCGRWLVIDTTGPHDAPGRGWENAASISDILLIDTATGRRHFLARSRLRHDCHLHPHPVFSPDGSTIFYNESSPDATGHRVLSISNPWIND